MAAKGILVDSIAYFCGETEHWRVALVSQGSIMVSLNFGGKNRSVLAYLAFAVFRVRHSASENSLPFLSCISSDTIF